MCVFRMGWNPLSMSLYLSVSLSLLPSHWDQREREREREKITERKDERALKSRCSRHFLMRAKCGGGNDIGRNDELERERERNDERERVRKSKEIKRRKIGKFWWKQIHLMSPPSLLSKKVLSPSLFSLFLSLSFSFSPHPIIRTINLLTHFHDELNRTIKPYF